MSALLSISCVAGCSSFGSSAAFQREGTEYETVKTTPNRDPEKAKELSTAALGMMRSCDWQAAEKLLRASLEADPTFGTAHNNLGRVYFELGQYYLAAWEFEYAISTMPNRPEPYVNLGLVYEKVGRLDEAIGQYQIAHDLDAIDPQPVGNLARVLLKQDPADPYAMELLRELVLLDTRPRWVDWARERLALHTSVAAEVSNAEGSSLIQPEAASPPFPAAKAEELPLPLNSPEGWTSESLIE